MTSRLFSAVLTAPIALFVALASVHTTRCEESLPPPLQGPVTKCQASLEYFSGLKPTGRKPPYQLTNLLRNKDSKIVTDVAWPKPDIFAPNFKPGEVADESYPVSNYVHDEDAPIKIWYQGCVAPAEAYLRVKDAKNDKDARGDKDEKAEKGSGGILRSFVRRFMEAKADSVESVEVAVTLESEYIQFEVTTRPANLQVGLGGIERLMTPAWNSAAESAAKEFGSFARLQSPTEVLGSSLLERLRAGWLTRPALFIKRETGGERGFVRLRLPIASADMRNTRASLVLARPDNSVVATGSYATFAPE
jgi:hypothetical protein